MSHLLNYLGYLWAVLVGSLRESAKRGNAFALFVSGERPRSPEWPKVEKAFRAAHPNCAACGGTTRIQVHHVRPFHLFPAEELDVANLVSLCMGPNLCHLRVGHGGDWEAYNPAVLAHAKESLSNPRARPIIWQNAKSLRRYS